MKRLKKFVETNSDLIDNCQWWKLADKIMDSDLEVSQITKLTDLLQDTTGLEGLTNMWCCFCTNKTLERFEVPNTVTEMSFNLFVNSDIGYLKLSPNTTKIDDEAFYKSTIHKLEMWSTNPIKILGSRLPKRQLEYIRYHGSLVTILERIDLSSYHATVECDDGTINLDPGYYVEVFWDGVSSDALETFQKVLPVLHDEGLDVHCDDGKVAVWEENGGFNIV